MTDIGGGIAAARETNATKYIFGSGIEIGALDAPYPIKRSQANVTYVDRLPKNILLEHYPELAPRAGLITEPDVLDDGESLSSFAAESQDFVIASHFLEHCENPILTLETFCRILKNGGHILLAVPNSANPQSWDHKRPRTSFAHLVEDDTIGTHVSRDEHYREWVTYAGGMTGEVARAEKEKLMKMNYSIHFHCWEEDSFLNFLRLTSQYKALPLRLIYHNANDYEISAILRKEEGLFRMLQGRSFKLLRHIGARMAAINRHKTRT